MLNGPIFCYCIYVYRFIGGIFVVQFNTEFNDIPPLHFSYVNFLLAAKFIYITMNNDIMLFSNQSDDISGMTCLSLLSKTE